jgi:peptidyl-prolyl cis-trans isomerase SurA
MSNRLPILLDRAPNSGVLPAIALRFNVAVIPSAAQRSRKTWISLLCLGDRRMFRAPSFRLSSGEKVGKLDPRMGMSIQTAASSRNVLRSAFLWTLFVCLTAGGPVLTLAQAAQPAIPVVLDRVVAVVNNQAILASDIDEEIRLSVLDPGRGGLGVLTRTRALDQLIGRAIIQQQIRQADAEAAEPSQDEVDARLMELRKELPACVRENCATDAGWNAFLFTHGLTPKRVEAHLRHRVEILRFIEQRFRQGISIPPEDIATYYHNTLLPQYAKGETVPPLDLVSQRIQEILLQQRVNALFDDWLSNLRKQGDIEVLDETLQAPAPVAPKPEPPAPETPTAPGISATPAPGDGGKASQ